jgi:hypothetical protein
MQHPLDFNIGNYEERLRRWYLSVFPFSEHLGDVAIAIHET